ncbi:acetyl-CoA carboxylase biotin carboxyl carrier protein subunit [Pullulanibacillus sp. KACC 23026]|uniref:acetyl-CoA carboxylase biotin carboxyl carrier protein subunit n=1 Tax=Pullulanibacillus sp. KACC 23026 TaxID=3028315 RepID=UPI0023B0EEBC|nr:acetyl-CoA carboxylase biotin carboxyl carrier protein subunit [Pullulanibacillus sp. KACC 23026]WEG11674.1 acetyl-CoA carboxylase biotin carboxyl carrier protein subunit [Pullulanibacillus sp. KACC 23026]
MKTIEASMAGTVLTIHVKVGDHVQSGDTAIVLESMKMEIPIESPESGTVTEIRVAEGDFVNESDVLVVLE